MKRHLVISLALSFSTLIPLSANSSGDSATIIIRNGNSLTTSAEFVKGRQNLSNGDLNQRYWDFYYSFVNNIQDLNQTACFTGNVQTAAEILKKVNDGTVGDNEEPIMKDLKVSEHELSFQRMNLRAENPIYQNTWVGIRIVRCGRVKPSVQSVDKMQDYYESAIGTSSFVQFLLNSIGVQTTTQFEVIREPLVLRKDPIWGDVLVDNSTCQMVNGGIRKAKVDFKVGDKLILKIKMRHESGRISMGLSKPRAGILESLDVICELPPTALVEDLEAALDGMFKIHQ